MSIGRYEPAVGEDIATAIRRAIDLSASTGEPTKVTFNGVQLLVNEESDPAEILDLFTTTMTINGKAHDTPKRRAEEAKKRAETQEALDVVIGQMSELDMSDRENVIAWFCLLEKFGGYTWSEYDRSAVLKQFNDAGFHAGENCREKNETMSEWRARVGPGGEFRWLVGQALDGIASVGCPHQMIHSFRERMFPEREGVMMREGG